MSAVSTLLNYDPLQRLPHAFSRAWGEGNLGLVKGVVEELEEGLRSIIIWTGKTSATLLYDAIREGQLPTLQFLVEAGADVNEVGPNGPVLNHAALFGNTDIIRYLLENGAEINAREKFAQRTALMMSISSGHTEAALYLIEQGAACDESVSTGDGVDWCTADFAAGHGNVQVYFSLYEKGAMEGDEVSPLMRACILGKPALLAACLEHPKIRRPAEDPEMIPILSDACFKREANRQLLLSWHTAREVAAAVGDAPSADQPRRTNFILAL